jgi:hypothetical protein
VDEHPAEPDVVLVVAVSDDADVQGALRSLRGRARTSTVVLARAGTRAGAAQVRGTRLVTYEVVGTAITEDEVIAAWRTLGPVLDEEARRTGSVEGPAKGPAGP